MNLPAAAPDLRAAIGRGEIVVHYQPQVAAASGDIIAVECLARWQHPERGLLSPNDFLPTVNNDESIIQLLGETVLRKACRDAREWPDITVGLNVSPVQFRLPSFADKLVVIARDEGLPLKRLELEILETSYFEDPLRMREMLTGLRAQGVKIALDDFGTGYSSLAALLELPLDKLKIDAGFVKKFEDVKAVSIIHAIVALARAIGLKITAEGVEDPRQQSFLRSAGCHYLQGYLFSRPVAADIITSMLRNPSRPR